MRFSWLLVGVLVGCGTSHTVVPEPDAGPPPSIPTAGATASLTVGAGGGTLELEDLELHVPAGAVAAGTVITVTVESAAPPAPFTGFSPVFRFEPAGLVFDEPVTVRLPFDGDPAVASVFWTTLGAAAYAPVATRTEGRIAIVESTHFSSAFVGTACSGDCCDRANGDLDVLLMVDNSNSMTEEQASLAAQIPRMARVLATGDLDGDGAQDFPALASVRVGTVSSDMGTGGYTIPTCAAADFGDDGVLRTAPRSGGACAGTYPSYAELRADDPSADVEGFVHHVSCVAEMGIGGCGFEQQLDAVLKALTPAGSPIRFHAGTSGHADGANAGFLRPGSVLATILLTDENDCSVADPELFDPSSPTYAGTDLNLRCFSHPEAVHPITRYVDGLRALRASPQDVIFAAIAGVPPDLVADPHAVDYGALLGDPRMVERVDPAEPNRLVASCQAPERGMAFPPRRIVEVARELGPTSVVQSICQEDFTPVIDAILTRVAARVSGSCGG